MSSETQLEATPPVASPRSNRFAALHNRNFSLYWGGMLVSNAGTWMQNVALGWWVVHADASPIGIGLLGASQAIPMLFLPPLGGAIGDRVNRLTLLKYTQWAQLLAAAAMAILIGGGHATLMQVLLLNGLSAVALAFDNPARQAFIADVVDRHELMSAISLNATAYQGAGAVGPAIAGILIPFIGIAGCLYVNAFSYVAVLIALFMIRHQFTPRPAMDSIGTELLRGFRYILRTRVVLSLLALMMCTSIFGRSYSVLLPLFAKQILHTGSAGFGGLQAMPGVGTLIGGFGLAAIGDVRRKGRLLLVTGLAFAAAVACFSVSRNYVLSLLLLLAVGGMSTCFGAMIQTLLQLEVPPEFRGRVFSLNTVMVIGMTSFGGFLLGAAATQIGTATAVALGAIIVALVTIAIVATQPGIRHYPAEHASSLPHA